MSINPAQRDAYLTELRRLDGQIGAARALDELKPIFYRLEEISRACPGDAAIQSAISDVRGRIVAFGQRLVEMQSTAEREAAAKLPGGGLAPPVQMPTQVFSSGSLTAQPPAYPVPAPPPGPAAPPPQAFNWKRAVAVGGVVGLLIAAAGIFTIRNAQKKAAEQRQAPDGSASIAIRTAPEGASIRVNGELKCTSNCSLMLPAGAYEVQAVLPGYETATSPLRVVSGAPGEVALTLQPMPLSVRLFTDLQAGKVTLDGNPLGDLQDGQLVLDRVAPGKHAVKVANQGTEAAFAFEARLGEAPVITGPVVARNVLAIVVANAGNAARVHASANVKVQVDGKAAGDAGPNGLSLEALAAGDRELTINDGSVERKLLVSAGPQPTLTAYLKLDVNLGSLYVAAGDLDDVTVFLNNTELKRKTKGGQLRLLGLPVRQYTVRVAKEGFTVEAAKSVTLAKGQETRVEFALKAIPKLASLRIAGAPPGAAVLLDGQSLGVIGADGGYASTAIPPGEHTVEFRKDSFVPKRHPRQFRAGETVELAGADVTLVAAASTIRVNVKPAGAQVFYRKSEETQLRPASGNPINLGAGSWVVVARAANFVEGTATVQVAAGENKTVEIALKEIPKPVVAKKLGTMVDWEQPGEWTPQEGWTVHKGGNFVLYGITPANGTFTFNIGLLKGRRLQWFVNYTDARNHVLYQLDRKNFFRRDVVNGKSSEYKIAHDLEKQESYTMQIDIAPGGVRHSVHNGAKWVDLDAFSVPGRNLSAGKFGLYIPGNDVFGLSNFRFNPR